MSAIGQFANSEKQQEIMKHIVEAASRGEVMTVDDLRAKLSYAGTCTRQAVLCSLKFLEKHGYILKQRTGSNKPMLIKPTTLGFATFKPTPASL